MRLLRCCSVGFVPVVLAALATGACGAGQRDERASVTPVRTVATTPTTVSDTATPALSPTPDENATPEPTGETGITGLVTVGPQCPVEREDSPCPDRPLSARITVWRGATKVAETRSGDDGRFKVLLPPGTYRVVGETEDTLPAGSEVEAMVVAGQLTFVHVPYDSGIR
jgi:hypothetical protein